MAGILESVPTIITTAIAAKGIVEAIVELAQDAKKIGKQMRADALPFRAFGDLIETAQYSIKFRLPQDNSAVISYMRDRQVLDNMEQEAIDLNNDIKEQKDKIRRLQSNFGDQANYALRFYAAHRWKNTRKPKLALLLPRMEQLKSTLQLIIAVIQLEVLSRNGGASQGRSRLDEIEELRQLIGKHIEAIGQLREDFAEQTGMNGERDSATGICYLAYTVAKTGRVPRSEPRTRFDFSQLKERPILSDDTLHWNPPPSNLPAGTPICPHCYRNTGKTNGNASNLGTSTRGTSNRNASNRIPSSRNTSHGSSRQTERDLPPLPQEPPRPQQPAALPPQQEIRVVAPVSDDTSSIYGDHEPQHVVTQPQPKEPELPAPQFNANPERAPEAESTNPGIVIEPPPAQDPLPEQLPEPQPEPEIGPVPKTNSDSGPAEAPPHPPSSFPYNVPDIPLIDGQVPPQSRSPSLYPESDHDLVPDVTSETNGTLLEAPAPWVTRSRRPTAERLPPVITSVEILNHKNQWHSMQVHLDTSLYIPNRHEAGRKEVHYYGIVSLRTLIDELGWPEETLLEDPRFVEIPNGKKFNWNLERHEGVGRVMLTWRVDQSDDEWANAVVPKMTRECIVSREDPCEQGVVLKAMPAAQNA